MRPKTLNLVSYSGGKDSGAMVLHLLEQGVENLVLVFCDTQWEHPFTSRYVFEFARAVGLRLKVLTSEGMVNLCRRKKRAPATKARFCTEELKLKPFQKYVKSLHAQGFETTVWIGERAEESPRRAKRPCDEYSEFYESIVARPILKWVWQDVIDIHKRRDVPLNPLYLLGFGRVGCMPCIMANKSELREIALRFPWVFERLTALEDLLGRTWFPPGFVPVRYCSRFVMVDREEWEPINEDDPDAGERLVRRYQEKVWIPTAEDVRRWALQEDVRQVPGQVSMFAPDVQSCASRYGLCE